MKTRITIPLIAGLLALMQPLTAAAQAEWLVAPYVWLSDVSLDQSSGVSGGISASDLLDKSDTAGMIRIESAINRWGLTFDYVWLGVSAGTTIPLPPPAGSLGLNAELDISIVELGGFFRPSGSDTGIDYLFGVRNVNSDKTLIAIPRIGPPQRFDGDETFTDVFAGARYRAHFGNEWDFNLRGDYSFGDSEGTWNLLSTVGYRFNQTFAMNLGYRHLAIEFEDTDNGAVETTEIELSGPILGFLFSF